MRLASLYRRVCEVMERLGGHDELVNMMVISGFDGRRRLVSMREVGIHLSGGSCSFAFWERDRRTGIWSYGIGNSRKADGTRITWTANVI